METRVCLKYFAHDFKITPLRSNIWIWLHCKKLSLTPDNKSLMKLVFRHQENFNENKDTFFT